MGGEPRAVNCSSCGAGQSIYGGGRVRAQVCVYCGATLEAAHGFRARGGGREMAEPDTPFQIGMEGVVQGVPVIITGVIGMIERHAGQEWRWTDHQVYSPSHGYAWLTWENGALVFTRKIRRTPEPARWAKRAIENAEKRPRAWLDDERFSYYESGDQTPTYVGGAFNFVPSVENRVYAVSFLGDTEMLTYADTGDEVEYELSVLLDRAETLRSFGLDPAAFEGPGLFSAAHPLTPLPKTPILDDIQRAGFVTAAFCLLVALFYGVLHGGSELVRTDRVAFARPLTAPFTVTDADRLVALQLNTELTNDWSYYEFTISDADGDVVLATGRTVQFYSGGRGEDRWTEGSRSTELRFHPPAEGAYLAQVALVEHNTALGGPDRRFATLSISQGRGSGRPAALIGGAMLLLALGIWLSKSIARARRFAGSDWSDE